MNEPHKYAEAIKAAADGKHVRRKSTKHPGEWEVVSGNNAFTRWGWWDNYEYQICLGYVEGKPVFEGDVLYGKQGGKIIAHVIDFTWYDQDARQQWLNSLSWNPPKHTFMLNGEQLPLPLENNKEDKWCFSDEFVNWLNSLTFSTREDANKTETALTNLLKGNSNA